MAGLGAKAECDRCGDWVRHRSCRAEWTGAFVCEHCFDPRPPQLDVPYIDPMEGMPVQNARLPQPPVYIDEDDPVTADDL